MKGYGKAVRDQLSAAGCVFVRHGRGDHDIWHSPINNQNFTVPVKIMSRHTANKILRDAGLPKEF
jgi:predicted RNA binding protein YcfA (HicA-like mRNA interferase family)